MNKKKVSAIILSSIVAVNSTVGIQAYATTDKNTKQVEAKSTSTPIINGIKVKKALIDINYSKGVIINPKYIVIHDTDNRNKGANAMANRNYFANHPNANASAHYLVDDSNIVQALEDNWRGWHVGDGNHPIYNNSNTIGIELCVNSDNDFDKTVEHGIELTKYLMKKHNIPAENVIRHNDVSGKICPKMMIQDRPELWGYFKRSIGATAAEESVLGKPEATGTVVNVSSTLNVRSNASTGSSVVSTLRKGESVNIYGEENGFYKIGYLAGSTYKYGYASKDYIKKSSSNGSSSNNNSGSSSSGNKKIGKVVNISTSLNVRSAASTSATIIGQLKLNEEVEILYTENGWHNIKLSNGKIGYVSSNYIEVKSISAEKPAEKPENKPGVEQTKKIGKVVNISTSLNVRSAPSTTATVVGQLKLNEEVEILYTENGWHNIKLSDGKVGYVSGSYIEIKSSTTNKPAEKPDDNNSSNNSDNEQTVKYGKVVNVSSTLNVRKSASTSSEVIGKLKPNEEVKILGTTNGWYKIGINGEIGYVSTQYIDIIKNSSNGTSTEVTKKIGIVTGISTSLNVRTSPSTSATVLGYLLNNEQVEILSTSNGWHKISFKNNKIGYVSTKYITVKEVKEQKVSANFVSEGTKGRIINAPINVTITEKPSAKSKVVSYLLNDSNVSIEGEVDDWYKVQFEITTGTKEGYVKKENIELL